MVSIGIFGNILELFWHVSHLLLNLLSPRKPGNHSPMCQSLVQQKRTLHITELPVDILNMIILMLAKSSDGAGDLVRLCSTCEYFKILIERPHVLSMVNLHRLTSNFDYTKYHGRNDLILQCALAQNPIAELILGKALLNDQEWFSDMPGDTWVIGDYTSSSGLLYSHKLVRSFILYGSCEDIINMHYKLIGYVVCYVRFDKDLSIGIIEAIDNMCSDNVSDRDSVIVLFDQLPPKTLVFEFRDFN